MIFADIAKQLEMMADGDLPYRESYADRADLCGEAREEIAALIKAAQKLSRHLGKVGIRYQLLAKEGNV